MEKYKKVSLQICKNSKQMFLDQHSTGGHAYSEKISAGLLAGQGGVQFFTSQLKEISLF